MAQLPGPKVQVAAAKDMEADARMQGLHLRVKSLYWSHTRFI